MTRGLMEVDRKALLMRDEQGARQAAWKLVFKERRQVEAACTGNKECGICGV